MGFTDGWDAGMRKNELRVIHSLEPGRQGEGLPLPEEEGRWEGKVWQV